MRRPDYGDDAVLTPGELAELFAVSTRTIRRRAHVGLLPAFRRVGGWLGYLLAEQLVSAGERVLDVPTTLAAPVRVLGTGRSNKNDPNDGTRLRWPRSLSAAIASGTET